MRFNRLTLAAATLAIAACGGGEKKSTDSTAMAAPAAARDSGASATPAAGTVAMAPITGKTWEIKMVGDDKGYRFEPASLTIKAGDGVKFVIVSMPPHNVAFDAADLSPEAKAQLIANMPDQTTAELSSRMMMADNDALTVSFGNMKPGKYPFHCTPHLSMGMKGEITVQ